MRTERALKVKLCQLKSNLQFRNGTEKEILLKEIKLLEWILNQDERSKYLKTLKK